MKSSAEGWMASTMRVRTPCSCRKCCPKRLRGRCELDGKLHRFDQAAGVGAAGARDVERGAVVDRGAHERQAEGHVDALAERRVLEHRQALVVVHREHRVGGFNRCGKNIVSAGSGPLASMPSALASAIAGAITSASSCPKWPDSPLCGLRPETRMRG